MPKYFVKHGSLSLPGKRPPELPPTINPDPVSVGVGESVDLTERQAEQLVKSGVLVDEKTFNALKKMVAAAAEAGAPLQKADRKFAEALKRLDAKKE